MSAATRQARTAAAVLSGTRGFGEVGIYTRQGAATGTSVATCITRRADPIWSGGQIQVGEDHFTGYLLGAAAATPPAIGDTLTAADGTVYEIDLPPVLEHNLWKLILRRRAAA